MRGVLCAVRCECVRARVVAAAVVCFTSLLQTAMSSSTPDGPFAPPSSVSTAVPPGRPAHASDPRSLLAARYNLQPRMGGLVALTPQAAAAAIPPSVKHAASTSNLHAGIPPRSHSPSISLAAGATATPSVSRPGGASTTQGGLLSPIPMHPGSATGANHPVSAMAGAGLSAQRGSIGGSPGAALSPSAAAASPAPPLSTASPLVLQRSLGFDKRSEASLVSLLTALSAVALAPAAGSTAATTTATVTAKVPDPKPFSMVATQAAMTLSPKEAAASASPPPVTSPAPASNDDEETTSIPPTAPPEAADLELRAQVAAVRRSAGAGHDVTEAAAALHGKHPSISSPLDALTGRGNPAEVLRHTKGLVEALAPVPSGVDPRWRSPFVSPPPKAYITSAGFTAPSENPGVAAVRAQYTSFDQHGEWRPAVARSADSGAPGSSNAMITSSSSVEPLPPIVPSISLATMDLTSNRTRSHAFRLAIRAALLTARTEKSYHACVTLLSGLTPSVAGNDNHAKLYPFLKLWNRASLIERKLARKSELKKQLDNLQKHMYYTPAAFGDQKVPQHRAAYHSWLKASATKIHEAMLKLAGEIDAINKKNRELLALKPLVGLVSKAFCCCFGPSKKQQLAASQLDQQHAPRRHSHGHDDEQEEEDNATIEEEERRAGAVALKSGDSFTYKSARNGHGHGHNQQRERDGSSTEQGAGAQPDRVLRKFGKRPAASALAKMQRHTNRSQRKNRNAARAAKRAANDGSAVEADEPDSPASEDSSDETWERTPAEEAERTRYLAAQAALRRAQANHEEDRRRVRDTAAIMKDLGLDEEVEEDSLSFKRSLGKVGTRVRNHRNPREGSGEVEDVHSVYAVLLWSLLRLEPDCARIAHTAVKSPADSGNASPRMLSPSSSIVGSPSGASPLALAGPDAPVNTHTLNPDFVSPPVHQVATVDHTRGSVVSPAGANQSNMLTPNPLHAPSHGAGGSSGGSHPRLTAPVQTVHSRTPQLSPQFNPISCKASRDFLENFASLYDVGLVFRGLTMLNILAVNQQRTEAYWRTCSATMVALEQLRAAAAAGGMAWTLHEQACYVLGLERLLEWSARCTANFARLFALPVLEYNAVTGESVGQLPPMINRQSTVDPAADSNAVSGEEQKQSDPATVPQTPTLQKRASIGTQGTNGAQLDYILNTHQEAFRACVQVMSRAWNTLQALITAAAVAAAAAATRSVDTLATAVVSNALAAPAAPAAPTFSLVKYLSPLLNDALSRLYEDLSWHAKRGAATTAELAPKPRSRANGSGGSAVRDTPLRGDEHLTLLLHSLIAEIVSLDNLGRTVVSGACPMIPPELLGDLARQTLIARFWADAHRYIGVERVLKLVAARRELALASAAGSPSSVESSAARQLGKEITAVFELYSALAWFQYSVQPPLLDPYTGQTDRLSVQPQTARAWLGLRGWFAPIVDGFLDTLLEGVDHDIGGVAASTSAPTTALHSISLKAVMQKMDAHLALLLYKPATRRHKRIMIDSLAAILVAYVEARLLTSSAPPSFEPSGALKPDASGRRSGLVEELQARYFLNRLYQARYPTVDLAAEGSKPDAKTQAALLKTAGSSSDLALTPAAALGPNGKPEHYFGFDPSIPRLTLNTIRNLNELRVANVKMDQLLRLGVGGGRPSLRRGTRARQVQNLFVQSCSSLASELCAVLLPATISNLLRVAPAGSGISNRWSMPRVEKCFAELLGFLFEHVEAIKTARAHVEVVRELGLYLMLETSDLLAAEMRNVSRLVHDGVVYFKAREESRMLTRDQLLRVEMALKVVRTFVIEVCAVPAYWFESSIPASAWSGLEGPLRDGSQLAMRLGLGPYAPKNLGVSAPPVVVGPPQPKYVLPPGYSSAYVVLTEIWKTERLLAVVMAPSATVIALYNSLGATEESIATAVQMAPAPGEESDEEEMAPPPPAVAASDENSGSDSDDDEERKYNGGGHLSPPTFNGATTPQRSAAPSNVGLSIDVSTPGGVVRQQGQMSLPQFPAPPRSGSFSQSPSGEHTLPPPPHVFQVLGYTRWDAHRLLVQRSKQQDDSAATDFLAAQATAQGVSSVEKVKPPGMPRDALAAHEPQGASAGLLGKLGSWFGSNKDTPKEAKPSKEKEKDKEKKADKSAAASAVPTRTGSPQAGTKLFGGPLSEAVSRAAASGSSSGVPRVIEDCLRFLRSNPAFLAEPGLFRVGGNQEAIEVLRSKYDERYDRAAREGAVEPKPTKLRDLHDVTGLLKLYYRTLPEPLLPFEFYSKFIKVGQNKSAETRVPQMKDLVASLPPVNLQNLQVLCGFLQEVAGQSAVNKMTAGQTPRWHPRTRQTADRPLARPVCSFLFVDRSLLVTFFLFLFCALPPAPCPR